MGKKRFTEAFDRDESGMTPAMGVILLIAITGTLAGILGYYVLSQQPSEPKPILDLAPEVSSSGIKFFHKGGDAIGDAPKNLSISLNGENVENVLYTGGDNNLEIRDKIIINAVLSGENKVRVVIVHRPSKSIIKKVILDRGDLDFGPSADFEYSPSSPTTVDNILFVDRSTESDGSITGWSWSFGDGSTSSLQDPHHQYSDNGTYEVTLTVTTSDNQTDTVSKNVEVNSTGPQAGFNIGDQRLKDENITFTDNSFDVDGEVVYYEWDWENDGNYDLSGPDENIVQHIYSENGTYAVKLRVTDDDGMKDTYSEEFEVSNPWTEGSGWPKTSYNNDFGVEARYGMTGDWELAIKPSPNVDFFWTDGQSYHFRVDYIENDNTVKFQVGSEILGPSDVSQAPADNIALIVKTDSANDQGTTAMAENLEINSEPVGHRVTATAPAGSEREISYIEFFNIDFSKDVYIEGDFVFDWQSSPQLEGPAMVIDFT